MVWVWWAIKYEGFAFSWEVLFRLPRRDENIIHRLSIGDTYLTHGHLLRGKTPLGAWLIKSSWLLSISCFIVYLLQMLMMIILCYFIIIIVIINEWN